jgi:BlaI family transcriptional regulator, penicillinase repressor
MNRPIKRKPAPSPLETTILALLWEHDGRTARQVLEALPDGKERAYTSVLSVLQVMEKKGLVKHTAAGTAHVYHAQVTRRQVLGPLLRNLVTNFFGGSTASALQHLMAETDVDEVELREIQRIIKKHGKVES